MEKYKAEATAQLMKERAKKLWAVSGVPQRHAIRSHQAMLGHKPWRAKYREVEATVGDRGIATLLGPRGTGKTQMAVEIARVVCLQHSHTARYLRATELFMELRKAYRDGSKLSERDAIRVYSDPWLLILDELQVRRHNEYEGQHLTTLIDLRYGDGKPTIMLANSTEQQFRADVGDSIWDRISETGSVWVFDWPSFRVVDNGNATAAG